VENKGGEGHAKCRSGNKERKMRGWIVIIDASVFITFHELQ